MRIAVCLKQVLDWDLPARDFRIDPVSKQPAANIGKLLLNLFDENALEVAVQLKERSGATVHAVTVGGKGTEEILRRAYAFGVDEAYRVDAEALGNTDAFGVAAALAAAVRRIGDLDLILCGRTGADWDRGLVGLLLAETLGYGCVPCGAVLEPQDGRLRVHREVSGGYEVVEAPFPAVVTVTNHEKNTPRLPKAKDLILAFRKPITVLTFRDLGLDPAVLDRRTVEVRELFVPASETRSEILTGSSGEALAASLLRRLRDEKLL